MEFCMQCGHTHKDGACQYHDSEGPCFCAARVPCDHVIRSRTVLNLRLVRVCACGQYSAPDRGFEPRRVEWTPYERKR